MTPKLMQRKLRLLFVSLIVLLSCAGLWFSFTRQPVRTATGRTAADPETISAFNYQRLEPGFSLTVTGEAAVVSNQKQTVASRPAARLETKEGKIILIETAPAGSAELNFDPATGQLQTMLLKGGVTIIRKDKKTGQIEFSAESGQAAYNYQKQEMTMTGNPVVHQAENEFRGEVIRYLLKNGKIFIEQSARGKIIYE